MKNLESLNLQELSFEEQVNIDGGAVPPYIWQAAVATFLYNVVADWDKNVAAFNKGFNGK